MASTSYGTLSVDPEVLVQTAEDAFVSIRRYREGLDAITKLIQSSDSIWKGEGGDTYRSVYMEELKAAEDALATYKKYPEELLAYFGLYSEVIATANTQADSIEIFQMA